VAAQHDRVEARAVFANHAGARAAQGAYHASTPMRCSARVGLAVVRAVGGQEHDVRAFLLQQPHQVHQAQRNPNRGRGAA
jgi:hypothetical protein